MSIMYIDLAFLFLIYAFASIALGISVYALWTLKEVQEQLRDHYNRKVKSAWDYYHNKSKEKSKGIWK